MMLKVTDICSTDPSDPTHCVTPADIKIDRNKMQIMQGLTANPLTSYPQLTGSEFPEQIWWFFTKCWDDVSQQQPPRMPFSYEKQEKCRYTEQNLKTGSPPTRLPRKQLVHDPNPAQQPKLVPNHPAETMAKQPEHLSRQRLAHLPQRRLQYRTGQHHIAPNQRLGRRRCHARLGTHCRWQRLGDTEFQWAGGWVGGFVLGFEFNGVFWYACEW